MTKRLWTVLLLVLLATALLRIRLLTMPLERDEGEYAYAGQLMLEGIPPYRLACNMKLPGTYAAYAALMALLGQSAAGIHIGLLLINVAAIYLVFLLGKCLFGAPSGIASSAAYALMSLGAAVMGTQAHATHFVVLAALGGILTMLRYGDSARLRTLAASGLLFGLAFLMKQHGIWFAAFGVAVLLAIQWRRGRPNPAALLLFGAAFAAPFLVTCLLLWRAGVFERFWFWTFTYARAYISEVTPSGALTNFSTTFLPLFTQNAALWIVAWIGFMRLWQTKARWPAAGFVTALLLFSFLAICPGFYFRPHYYVMLLPAIALFAGAAVQGRISSCIFGAALLVSLVIQRDFLFLMTPAQASRSVYGFEPFREARTVAEWIRDHSAKDATIAVLGSEPEIYFYAHRHSATSFIYMYGLMESQPYSFTMQEDMIRELTETPPEFVVEVDVRSSWVPHADSPTALPAWWRQTGSRQYTAAGAVDFFPDRTEYRWGAETAARRPQPVSINVYRRIY